MQTFSFAKPHNQKKKKKIQSQKQAPLPYVSPVKNFVKRKKYFPLQGRRHSKTEKFSRQSSRIFTKSQDETFNGVSFFILFPSLKHYSLDPLGDLEGFLFLRIECVCSFDNKTMVLSVMADTSTRLIGMIGLFSEGTRKFATLLTIMTVAK